MKVYLKIVVGSFLFVFMCFNSTGQNSALPYCDDALIEKVKKAMLCMQRYSWEQGVAMQGMLEIGDTIGLILMARESLQRSKPDGRLSMVGSDFNISDTGINGPGVLAAYPFTGDEKYKKAAQEQYEYFFNPDTRNFKGLIYHNNRSKVIFSDNMFMVAPFLALMGDFDEAIAQIEGIRRVLWNEEVQLFHHMKIEETGEWKDIDFWGGGNGWCAAAMAQVIGYLPADRKSDKQKLMGYYTDLLEGCLAHQLPSGLFYDNVTIADFEETTMAAMVAFSIYSGLKAGWLDSKYKAAADKMRAGVLSKIDEYGLLQQASAAPGFNSPGTSPEGQAFVLMMEGAFRKIN